MNKKYQLLVSSFQLLALLFLAGCDGNKLVDPGAGNPTGTFGDNFVIYDDELKSGGGAFLYPGSNSNLDFAFDDTSNAVGLRSIRFSWNGGAVGAQSVFTGFSLSVSQNSNDFASTPARDYSASGYTKIKFKMRGTLVGDDIYVELKGPDDGLDDLVSGLTAPTLNVFTLSSSWTEYTISPVTSAHLAVVKEFFKATCINNNAPVTQDSCTLYIDDIRYEK